MGSSVVHAVAKVKPYDLIQWPVKIARLQKSMHIDIRLALLLTHCAAHRPWDGRVVQGHNRCNMRRAESAGRRANQCPLAFSPPDPVDSPPRTRDGPPNDGQVTVHPLPRVTVQRAGKRRGCPRGMYNAWVGLHRRHTCRAAYTMTKE